MKRTSTLTCILALSLTTAVAQNTCSSALTIGAGTYTVAAVDGPEIPVPICANTGPGALHTEWYVYTPAQDYTLTVTTDLPQNANGDTRFHIYQGSCGALTCVGGADDQGTVLLAATSVQVSSGLTYRIAFDDRWSADGFDFQLIESDPVVTEFDFTVVTAPGAGGYNECVVDMNGDALDDIVGAAGSGITIAYQQPDATFELAYMATGSTMHQPTWSIAAGDLDGNGYTDLMYGGGSGATFMMANANGTSFGEQSFSQYIFCQRTNFVDLNADGNLDAFSCHDVDANVAFYNTNGDGILTFVQGGLGQTCGNYGSIWIDYDNDSDVDLFVAKCGCDPVDILMRNNGDGTFTNVAPMMNLADGHSSWSSAWGDFDNDGDMDVLIGSSGSATSKLMRNDGNTFTSVLAGSGFDTFTGTSIEWTTHDFNNDGWLDILGGGELMLNNGDFTFTPSTANAPFAGAVGDLNNDGFLDVLSGGSMYMNTGNTNKYLRIDLVGVVSNLDGIGARVEVTTAAGTQIRDVRSGDAFSTMSSIIPHFGLGVVNAIEQVVVRWPSGVVDVIDAPAINSTIQIIEGSGSVSVPETRDRRTVLYPNPTERELTLQVDGQLLTGSVRVLDITGQEVLRANLDRGRVDVQALPAGLYIVESIQNDQRITLNFTKH